jgi:diacylglycerol O-acyltransferase
VFSQALDRSKPLWEIWLVDRVGDDAFALISKTHHALVDGVSGVDISTVLFDLEPDPPEPDPPPPWFPRPEPSQATLLATSIAERASVPFDAARALADAIRRPERALAEGGRAAGGIAAMAAAGMSGAPPSPLNVRIGPHRRFAWVDAELDRFKAIKSALGGTVNDVVLTVVTGALREFMIGRGRDTEGVELKAMVPVSVRADEERGALGNRVAAMYAPLPIYADEPLERFRIVHEAMGGLKESGQAVGAEVLTRLAGFAAPTILDQAARLQTRQRFFNVVVTNVPGPQFPLYLQGRRLRAFYPQVPLTLNTALGIAIMSYDGRLGFGLLADYDALPELDDIAGALEREIAALAAAAGVTAPRRKGKGGRPASRRKAAAPAS